MSTRAYYHPRGIRVDLSELSDELYEEIASLRGQIKATDPPALTCLGNGESMYVYRHESGRHFARHFPGGNRDGHVHPIAKMSTEHRNQAEYCQRAASEIGLKAELEVPTSFRTRLDVAVFGPVPTGLEVQRSQLTLASAKSRDTRSSHAGFTCAWISDSEKDPPWTDHVPTVRLVTRGGWDRMPPAGSAMVIIGRFHRERDQSIRSGWRYVRSPYAVTLDELSQAMPYGEIVPVQIGSPKKRRVVLAHRSAVEIIDSCTYEGASTYKPIPEIIQGKDAPQRFSQGCRHGEAPAICFCGHPLWAPQSIERGYCEACRLSVPDSRQLALSQAALDRSMA